MAGYEHFILFHDETGAWCAAPPGFQGLVTHPAGWGPTREDAIEDLFRSVEFKRRLAANEWPAPGLRDFVEVPEPDGAKFCITYDLGTQAFRRVVDSNFMAMSTRRRFRVINGGAHR